MKEKPNKSNLLAILRATIESQQGKKAISLEEAREIVAQAIGKEKIKDDSMYINIQRDYQVI